jgi:hypothetical protein
MLLEVPLVIHLRFPLVFGRSPGTCCFLFPVTLPVSCSCDASRMNQDVGLTYLMHRAQHPLFGTMRAEHQRARSANTVDSAVVCRAIVTISTSNHGNKHNASHVYKQSHQSRHKHRNRGRLLAPERRPTTPNHNDGNPNSPRICTTTISHRCKFRIRTTRSLLLSLSPKTTTNKLTRYKRLPQQRNNCKDLFIPDQIYT